MMRSHSYDENDLKQTVVELADQDSLCRMCHLRLGFEPLPQEPMIHELVMLCRSVLFPGFFGKEEVPAQSSLFGGQRVVIDDPNRLTHTHLNTAANVLNMSLMS